MFCQEGYQNRKGYCSFFHCNGGVKEHYRIPGKKKIKKNKNQVRSGEFTVVKSFGKCPKRHTIRKTKAEF